MLTICDLGVFESSDWNVAVNMWNFKSLNIIFGIWHVRFGLKFAYQCAAWCHEKLLPSLF